MFFAVKPYEKYDRQCDNKILIFDSEDLSIEYVDLCDLGDVAIVKDDKTVYFQEVGIFLRGYYPATKEYIHLFACLESDYSDLYNSSVLSRYCEDDDIDKWNILSFCFYLYVTFDKVLFVRDDIPLCHNFNEVLVGVNYLFRFREYIIIRYTTFSLAYNYRTLSFIFDTIGNLLTAYWDLSDIIYGDKVLALKIETLLSY